ncbi:MAG: tRNA (adenosine(37)-N6)-threonylcarbamoyltransferase complex dimerization subunit type 1 TsaB [Acidobacteriota bacterium]
MSKLILALDTTCDFGSVALSSGKELIEEIPLRADLAGSRGYSHLLFGSMEDLLRRHGYSYRDVACFASASGPGTFSGVRMGLTAVKGLADACAVQVVGVSNLQALAWFGKTGVRAPVIDARRGDLYSGLYNAQLVALAAEMVSPASQWISTIPIDAEVIVNGAATALIGGASSRPITEAPLELARAVAAIAAQRFSEGLAQDPAELDANYVRRSDASMMWRDTK